MVIILFDKWEHKLKGSPSIHIHHHQDNVPHAPKLGHPKSMIQNIDRECLTTREKWKILKIIIIIWLLKRNKNNKKNLESSHTYQNLI